MDKEFYKVKFNGIEDIGEVIFKNNSEVKLSLVKNKCVVTFRAGNVNDLDFSLTEAVNFMENQRFTTENEAINYLSEQFRKALETITDGQEAFNSVMDKYDGIIKEDFVYSLTGGDWGVTAIFYDLKEIQDYFEGEGIDDIKDIDDACDYVYNRVSDTMCNVGCDMYTALKMEIDNGLPDCFEISGESDEAYIEKLIF